MTVIGFKMSYVELYSGSIDRVWVESLSSPSVSG